ncbi:MAG: hypothetical protein H7256_10520, partial [Bdellovibrio sp.]|nr:hypothetical protein [Bdellovibrio sp.]
KKQISLIDEIRDHQTRWLYIRENPEFKKVIDDVRPQIDAKNDATKTLQSSTSLSGTKPIEDTSNTDRYQLPQFTNVSLQTEEASVVSETVNDLIGRVKANDAAEKSSGGTKFVYQYDKKTQQEIKVFSKSFVILISVLFVLVGGGIGGFYFYTKYSQQKIESEMLTQIKKYKYLGLDKQAVSLYGDLPKNMQQKHFVDVVDLFPLLEAAAIVQVRDLEDLEAVPKISLESRVSIYMSRFWSSMQTQNLDSAQNQIIKAKTLLPSDPLVNENEAILNIRKGQHGKALAAFLKLYNDNNQGRYLVGALESLQGLSGDEKVKNYPVLEKLVDRHIALRFDYRKELLLVQMAFAKIHQNDVLFRLSWKQFINMPVRLSALFQRPALVAPFSYQWKDLEQYKVIVREGLTVSDDTLFKVHDYLESTQLGAAVDYAEKNKDQISDVSVRQQITLLILYALNKKSEILTLEKTNQLDKKSELNHILLALTKVNLDATANVDAHLAFFKENNLKFYQRWVELSALINRKAAAEIRSYLKENFPTETSFTLVNEGRGLLD